MEKYLVAALLALVSLAGLYLNQNGSRINPSSITDSAAYDSFSHWKQKHAKSYSHEEDQKRFQVYKKNMIFVFTENLKNHSFTLDLNQFADLESHEFKKLYTGYKPDLNRPRNEVRLPTGGLPSTVDWRTKGAVTPVKNQGQCGSCWAFSTTGSLEGLNYLKNGHLQSYSEQQLVDCSGSYGNQGCNGGLMDNAFKYVEAHGITLESSYPYTAEDGTCHSFTSAFKNTGFVDVPKKSESQLQAAVNQQPVSIAIDAGCLWFQFYFGGVFSHNCGTSLDHGVLLVGYGTDSGKDYWLVKNSWGSSWGSSGYIKMERGYGGSGLCGILLQPSYPTLN